MPNATIEELVEAALERLPGEPTEDAIHDVFTIIETDPYLHSNYKALCKQYVTPRLSGPGNVNPTIAYWVKTKTGRSKLPGRHRSTRSSLIKAYSKLG